MSSLQNRLTAALSDRYRLERELGAGGMATVFLAEDLKHLRKVAVKVLHPELAAVIGADRFLTEIRTTASLQHPHILALHDSGQAGELLYYVMPYVEGESLRARLERERQLPIEDAVRIVREVADALGYAHAHGIIHRDIKPENILLQGGHALVADFGIALAVKTAGGARMTQTGLSLGTPQYMSPEQAMGERTVDARSDIYALGAVTYEMLTGEPPFTGATVQAVVAKVMAEKPLPPSTARDTVPPALERAVLRALAKLPADRWSSATAFADALSAPDAPERVNRELPLAARAGGRARRAWIGTHAMVTLGALGLSAWLLLRPHAGTDLGPVRFSLEAGPGEHFNMLAIQPIAVSPDGYTIVWVGEGSTRPLVVRTLDDLAPRTLPGTAGASAPFFSPDGRWIAFFSSTRLPQPGTAQDRWKLLKVPVEGGPVIEIADDVFGFGGAWTADDRIVVGGPSADGGLASIPASGGALTPVLPAAGLDSLDRQHRWPRLLEDGQTVLFTSWNAGPNGARAGIASLASGKAKLLGLMGEPLAVIGGRLLYMTAAGVVMAVPFDPGSWTVAGEAMPVLEGPSIDDQGGVRLALSASGSLVYAMGADQRQLVLVDSRGAVTPLLEKTGLYANPRFSPDGRRIALDIAAPSPDVWIFDRVARTLDRVTTSGRDDRPEWTPDGARVLFRSTRMEGNRALYWQAVDGGSEADSLFAFREGEGIHEGTFAPDGKTLIIRTAPDGGGRDIWFVRLGEDEAPQPVLTTAFDELQPRLSPDGRWLAYVSDESGTLEVYVREFPTSAGRVRVSVDGGTEPIWAPEGDRLFYRSDRRLMAAKVQPGTTFGIASRATLFEGDFIASGTHAAWDAAPGGREFVMIAPAGGRSEIVVVLDWHAELRARFGAANR